MLCRLQNLVPVGISDIPRSCTVKLFCCQCRDIYNPKSSAHNSIDGAFFGTSFAHMFFLQFPSLLYSVREERYVPKIFGFKLASQRTLELLAEKEAAA